MRNQQKTITSPKEHHQKKNQFLMKTGILLRAIQQRTQLNILKQQNQQSTTQTKPSVVVQPRQMKDLSRKILNERLVKVLIKKRLAISSLVKIVILSSKPNLGKQQRTGKVLGLEQIKVIAIRSHGLPSFFFAVHFNVLHTYVFNSFRFSSWLFQDHGSKTCLRVFFFFSFSKRASIKASIESLM